MQFKRLAAVACLACGLFVLSGCDEIDESVLDTSADFSVSVNIPYATTTPAPGYLTANNGAPLVIDQEGKVIVQDSTLLNSNPNQTTESAYTMLQLGDTGLAVQSLQQRMQQLEYFTAGISGIFDSDTETAVKHFEQTFGVMQTGIATPALQRRLYASDAPVYRSEAYENAVVSQYNTLQKGSVGSSVYALQHRLRELGYPIMEMTAIFDEDTGKAVELFCNVSGLEVQPVAYITMQRVLYSDTAPKYKEGETVQVLDDANALRLGNVGTLVMQIQNRLIDLGYMSSDTTATGIYDVNTEGAVRLFQEACGFPETGALNHTLQAILLSDQAPAYGTTYSTEEITSVYTELSLGSTGDAVLDLQNRLVQLGYAAGAGTGNYDEATVTVLKLFQHYNGLDETGIATPDVQSALFSPAALSYQDVLSGLSVDVVTNVDATPEPTEEPEVLNEERPLTLGMSGDDVATLQARLNTLGYAASDSGEFDEATMLAVRKFQSAVGVSQTGDASVELQHYLFSRAAPPDGTRFYNATQNFVLLQPGDVSDNVTELQRMLWKLGYLLTDDIEDSIGTYNAATELAVQNVQVAMEYETTDGIAGPEFQCFIFSEYNKFIKK